MANAFIDTNALVKYYHPEEGTQEVTQIIEEPVSRHYISRLSLVETVSAFAVKFRQGLTSDSVRKK
jgi:predicted nucleic-acid-binding protein